MWYLTVKWAPVENATNRTHDVGKEDNTPECGRHVHHRTSVLEEAAVDYYFDARCPGQRLHITHGRKKVEQYFRKFWLLSSQKNVPTSDLYPVLLCLHFTG